MSEPTLFYVYVFSNQLVEFIPVSVANTKAEGEIKLATIQGEHFAKYNQRLSGAVIEMTWQEFCTKAQNTILKSIDEKLDKLLERA